MRIGSSEQRVALFVNEATKFVTVDVNRNGVNDYSDRALRTLGPDGHLQDLTWDSVVAKGGDGLLEGDSFKSSNFAVGDEGLNAFATRNSHKYSLSIDSKELVIEPGRGERQGFPYENVVPAAAGLIVAGIGVVLGTAASHFLPNVMIAGLQNWHVGAALLPAAVTGGLCGAGAFLAAKAVVANEMGHSTRTQLLPGND